MQQMSNWKERKKNSSTNNIRNTHIKRTSTCIHILKKMQCKNLCLIPWNIYIYAHI